MKVLQSVFAAFSMFSVIPVPQPDWDRSALKGMLAAFPLVGVVIGCLSGVWVFGCGWIQAPPMLRALGLCLIPLFVTGGIHLDGCCDTWDALASHGSPEKKREILNDPHIGSFAAWKMAAMLLEEFVFWTVLEEYRAAPVLGGYVLSRSLSAIAVASFPVARGSGLVRMFAESAEKKMVLGICLTAAAASALAMVLSGELLMVSAAVLVFVWYRYCLVPGFGGISGDLAGWFVQMSELWMLAAMVLSEEIGRMGGNGWFL